MPNRLDTVRWMVTLRSGRAQDAHAILDVWREAEVEPTPTDDAERLRHLMDANADALIVAEDDGRLIGTVIAAWDGWRGGIYRLAVVPGHRRQGLGQRLVDEAVRRLRTIGAARLSAIVADDDEGALSFWTAMGWHRQTARARFVTNL
jgi:ribosomal protein S18 acetylase RimI-like enzyme